MTETMIDDTLRARLDLPYEQAVEHVTAALKDQGFGVLSEIDVRATLKKKLDVDFRKYAILGACNPPLAHQALTTELETGEVADRAALWRRYRRWRAARVAPSHCWFYSRFAVDLQRAAHFYSAWVAHTREHGIHSSF
jgi:hypothetical protein